MKQPKRIGYARISTKNQSLERQVKLLMDEGIDDLFSDVTPGDNMDRPGLKMALEALEPGDILVVAEWDRLSRSFSNSLKLFSMINEAQARLLVIDRPTFDFTNEDGLKKLKFLALVAEEELARSRKRTTDGLAIAKQSGSILGRRRVLSRAQSAEVVKMTAEGRTTRELARIFRVSPSTISRAARKG